MSVERNIRYELIARLCPNSTGAELRSVCTEAGMFAIRSRRKVANEKDFLDAVDKVIRQGSKFSSTGPSLRYYVASGAHWSAIQVFTVSTTRKMCLLSRSRQFAICGIIWADRTMNDLQCKADIVPVHLYRRLDLSSIFMRS